MKWCVTWKVSENELDVNDGLYLLGNQKHKSNWMLMLLYEG